MKTKLLIMAVVIATVCLYGCKGCHQKKDISICDNTINDWSHFIPKDTAIKYIQLLKARKLANTTNNGIVHALDSSNMYVAELFLHARDMMRNMMLRDSCRGIRVYYGLKENRIIPIICGTDSTKNDIYWRHTWPIPNTLAKTARKTQQSTDGTIEVEVDGLLDVSLGEPPVMVARGIH